MLPLSPLNRIPLGVMNQIPLRVNGTDSSGSKSSQITLGSVEKHSTKRKFKSYSSGNSFKRHIHLRP